jgi:hypothetical protein
VAFPISSKKGDKHSEKLGRNSRNKKLRMRKKQRMILLKLKRIKKTKPMLNNKKSSRNNRRVNRSKLNRSRHKKSSNSRLNPKMVKKMGRQTRLMRREKRQ